MNDDYEPTENQETVLAVLKDEIRVNPLRVRNVTGMNKQRVNDALDHLTTAGWVTKVNRGLYEFVGDPRDNNHDTNHDSEQP